MSMQFAETYAYELLVLTHVLLAMAIGGLIGLEREFKKRPAGFRTHMLVAASAALFTDLATGLVMHSQAWVEQININTDPARVIVAIVTGVSFLGTGTIFHSDETGVSGLTTAATLLFSSALGIAVALNYYLLATGLAIIVVIVLRVIGILSDRFVNPP